MKKALSLILALVLCLSLVACGGNKTSAAVKAVVGEWSYAEEDLTAQFNIDNTGVLTQDEDARDFTWKYDEDLNGYIILLNGQLLGCALKTVDGVAQLNIRGYDFVRAESGN